MKPRLWRNDKRAPLEYGRSLVRTPIWSNLDYEIGMCCLSANHIAILYSCFTDDINYKQKKRNAIVYSEWVMID
jgi:hypothetical protein